ncbi:unnamed protein product [Lampetra fluviatilis]
MVTARRIRSAKRKHGASSCEERPPDPGSQAPMGPEHRALGRPGSARCAWQEEAVAPPRAPWPRKTNTARAQ